MSVPLDRDRKLITRRRILTALRSGPLYEGAVWFITPAATRADLRALEANGLIARPENPYTYELTEAGREALNL